jgi:putative glutamine transport system permease protein
MFLKGFLPLFQPENLLFLFQGLLVTLQLAVISIAISAVIGLVVGVVRFARLPFLSALAGAYVDLIRNLPLLLLIFFAKYGLGALGLKMEAFQAGVTALSVFAGAIIAEIVRGGLNSIPKGQWEAARSQGFSYVQTLRFIILPQALKKMIPALVQQFITLTKDTSYVYIINVKELTSMGAILFNLHNNAMQTMLLIALVFFVINFGMSVVARRLEYRLKAASY